MASANMTTKSTDRFNEIHQDTQLALTNLDISTAYDRNDVHSLTETIACLTTEISATNSDIDRLRGNIFCPHLPPRTMLMHTLPPRQPLYLCKNAKNVLGIQRITVGHMDKKSPSFTHPNHASIA